MLFGKKKLSYVCLSFRTKIKYDDRNMNVIFLTFFKFDLESQRVSVETPSYESINFVSLHFPIGTHPFPLSTCVEFTTNNLFVHSPSIGYLLFLAKDCRSLQPIPYEAMALVAFLCILSALPSQSLHLGN